MEPKFHLKITSREGIIFEGDVESITSFNAKGKFDVLGSHANFISLIQRGITVRMDDSLRGIVDNKLLESQKQTVPKESTMKEIGFDNALMRVKENNVEVYIGVEGQAKQLPSN